MDYRRMSTEDLRAERERLLVQLLAVAVELSDRDMANRDYGDETDHDALRSDERIQYPWER